MARVVTLRKLLTLTLARLLQKLICFAGGLRGCARWCAAQSAIAVLVRRASRFVEELDAHVCLASLYGRNYGRHFLCGYSRGTAAGTKHKKDLTGSDCHRDTCRTFQST